MVKICTTWRGSLQALQRNVVQNDTLYLWSILHFCKVIIFNTLLDVLTIYADYHFWCQFLWETFKSYRLKLIGKRGETSNCSTRSSFNRPAFNAPAKPVAFCGMEEILLYCSRCYTYSFHLHLTVIGYIPHSWMQQVLIQSLTGAESHFRISLTELE